MADIIGQFLPGVALAVIALTKKGHRTGHGLVAIALNHSIGTQNATPVLEIVERQLADSTGYAAGDGHASQELRGVTCDIQRQRDSARADVLKQHRGVVERTSPRPALTPSGAPRATAPPTSPVAPPPPPSAIPLRAVSSPHSARRS